MSQYDEFMERSKQLTGRSATKVFKICDNGEFVIRDEATHLVVTWINKDDAVAFAKYVLEVCGDDC